MRSRRTLKSRNTLGDLKWERKEPRIKRSNHQKRGVSG